MGHQLYFSSRICAHEGNPNSILNLSTCFPPEKKKIKEALKKLMCEMVLLIFIIEEGFFHCRSRQKLLFFPWGVRCIRTGFRSIREEGIEKEKKSRKKFGCLFESTANLANTLQAVSLDNSSVDCEGASGTVGLVASGNAKHSEITGNTLVHVATTLGLANSGNGLT